MAGINIKISAEIKKKLFEKHAVSETEVLECFYNREHGFVDDERAEHKTDPPTTWFVSETDKGRKLKIILVLKDSVIHIKSAYEAKETVQKLYRSLQKE